MRSRKLFFLMLGLFSLSNLFLPSVEPAVQKIIVTDSVSGEVISFYVPEGIHESSKTNVGIFIQKIDDETGYVDVKGKIEQCFILEEIRNRLHRGDYVYLVKNIRDDKKTEWDVISVGEKVSGPKPTNTIILQPPPSEERVEEGFPEITLSTATVITTTTTEAPAALSVSTSSLSNGTEGSSYSATLSASSGTSPYTWSLVSGSLPTGLSLSSGGVISGTPGANTAGNTYSFTVRVTDSVNATADKALTLKVGGYDWDQVNTDGFGDITNISLRAMVEFNSSLYASTGKIIGGAEIWRSSDGTTWTQVNSDGFGSANNFEIISLHSFSSRIYAGTENDTDGAEIWRTSDGTTWAQVSTDFGSSNTKIHSMATYGTRIYAGTKRSSGGRVYRSSDGDTWTQSGSNGLGDTTNKNIKSLAVFGSNLYAGTGKDSGGAEVFSFDGTTYTQVNTEGFGDSNNITINSLVTFGSYIYASTEKISAGAEIWRSSDGTTWTQVNTDGFGDSNNIEIHLGTSSSYIYAGTKNLNSGGEVWRSSDGTTWTQVNSDGFGDTNNMNARAITSFSSYVYAAMNDFFGCELWRFNETVADPEITGRIYDSVTGENISSPTTSIYEENSTTALSSTTANPYSFNVLDGKYYFRVEKEGYTFPSNTKDGVTAGDHGEVFTASGTSMTIDIPIDQGYPLEITKTANKRRVVNGDIITYDIKIKNNSMWNLLNINIIDEITNGFKYVKDKTYVDDTQLSEKNIGISNRKATFKLTNVPGYKVTHLTYQVRVGSGISPGEYKTIAKAWDRVRDWRMSNESSNKIEVVYDALFTLGTIIGKVFNDTNGDGVQEKGENGIPDVRIATEYGVIVETDKDGKYHIPAVPPGSHLLKLDMSSLPAGNDKIQNPKSKTNPKPEIQITTENPYFVKITEGLLAKVNFGISELASERVSELAGKEEPANPQTRKPANPQTSSS